MRTRDELIEYLQREMLVIPNEGEWVYDPSKFEFVEACSLDFRTRIADHLLTKHLLGEELDAVEKEALDIPLGRYDHHMMYMRRSFLV